MISIITPVYNTGALLYELAESLRRQHGSDMEWVVVDDGSDAATKAILQQIQQEIAWMRLYIQEGNRGGCAARNRGIKEAKGEWLKFLDADDLISDNMLRIQQEATQDPTVDVVVSPVAKVIHKEKELVYGQPRLLRPQDVGVLDFMRHGKFHHSGCLFRKTLVQNAGGWNESLKADQDGDFLYRLWQQQPRIVIRNDCTFYYREHQLTDRITKGVSQEKIASRLSVCAYIMSHPGGIDPTALREAVAVKMNQIAYMALPDAGLFKLVEAEYERILGARPSQLGRPIEKVFKRILGFRTFMRIKQRIIRCLRCRISCATCC